VQAAISVRFVLNGINDIWPGMNGPSK